MNIFKFSFSALRLKAVPVKPAVEKWLFLGIISCFVVLPAQAAEQAVLGVVKSEENAGQWAEITARLQNTKIPYCVIDLSTVTSAADLGDRSVVFLPNLENITSTQALSLEAWMSQGGRVIASGPVGNTSQPGVRQLLRSLLGAYWGFNLSAPSKLQPLKTRTSEWMQKRQLGGVLSGGVVIPTGINSQTAAIWQSQDSSPAVITTEKSTVLGWRWGVNSIASAELDSAWLQAVLSRYVQLPDTSTTESSPQNCNSKVAAAAKVTPQATATATTQPEVKAEVAEVDQGKHTRTDAKPRVSTQPTPVQTQVASQRSTPRPPQDPIEQILPPGLGVAPNSKTPFTGVQAIALKQELDNLIGRFESAQLTANARGGERNQQKAKGKQQTTASINPQYSVISAEKVVAAAKEIAKTLPQLIAKQDYATAQQQWLKAQQLLRQNYPVDQTLAQPEIRAMWLDRGTIVSAGSEQQLAKIFDRLAAAGINTVFFETVNAGYPIYPSQVAQQPNPLVRGWDPLASAVKLAHERDMELHAWVWAFAVGNQRHNTLINLPADYPGPVITAHPDWASYDNRGSLFPPGQGKPFLDPANRAARQYLLRLFDEIVSRYQVDGLQLDYIRYPFQDPSADRTYGYGIAARQQFQQMTGVDPVNINPSDRQLWQQWTDFRTRQVDSFVAEVSQQLRQQRPNLIISVAVFPLSEHERIHKLQQHWEVWASRGDVDLIVPMTYAPDTYRFQRLAQPWLKSNKLGSTLLLPGIRLLNLPVLEAVDQIQLSRDLSVSGYSLFAVENLSSELQKVFNNTQGINSNISKAPIPYRQPFQTVAARYATLKQEWNFLLENNQLWLRGAALSDFKAQSEDLENAFNQLAQNPSSSNLAAARVSLNAFQKQFDRWMRSQGLENPYQVKVWSNRLVALERLLSYGERVVLKRESTPVAEQR